MSRFRAAAASFAAVALAGSLAACSSNDTEQANESFCAAHEGVRTQVEALQALATSGGATVTDVRNQAAATVKSVQAAEVQAQDLTEAVRTDIQAADQAFAEAIAAIPQDASQQEGLQAYQAAAQAWGQSMAAIRAEVGCTSAS
jgi:hypothetical protein